MTSWEVLFIGIALSMDAFAVGMTDGMLEPEMGVWKTLAVAGAFALFQFFMPLCGYFFGAAFSEFVSRIAPWLSFVLLGLIGGKMIFDYAAEHVRNREERLLRPLLVSQSSALTAGKLFVQAVATSLDALAVGVTLLAVETSPLSLPFSVYLCALVIGLTTLSLSLVAVSIGKKAGDKFSGQSTLLGGVILVFIGLKILLEGVL